MGVGKRALAHRHLPTPLPAPSSLSLRREGAPGNSPTAIANIPTPQVVIGLL
jgi:hypothetical protein